MIDRIESAPSTDHAGARRDPFLKDIVTLIVARYKPSRVFLFGSRARGDFKSDSDYDFPIEVAEVPKDERTGAGRMFHLSDLCDRDVQIHVRLPGELEEQSDDPGTIDWDVAREGVLLYTYEQSGTNGPTHTIVREKKRGESASIKQWLRRADNDLSGAEQLARNVDLNELVCFHCQQAAEKFLKALIISAGVRPMRTHDLTALLGQAETAGYRVSSVIEDCKYLTPFAVDLRYPPSIEIDGERALAAARRIEAGVRNNLKSK